MGRERITAGARPPRGSMLDRLLQRVDDLEDRIARLERPAAAAAEPSPAPRPRPPKKAAPPAPSK